MSSCRNRNGKFRLDETTRRQEDRDDRDETWIATRDAKECRLQHSRRYAPAASPPRACFSVGPAGSAGRGAAGPAGRRSGQSPSRRTAPGTLSSHGGTQAQRVFRAAHASAAGSLSGRRAWRRAASACCGAQGAVLLRGQSTALGKQQEEHQEGQEEDQEEDQEDQETRRRRPRREARVGGLVHT